MHNCCKKTFLKSVSFTNRDMIFLCISKIEITFNFGKNLCNLCSGFLLKSLVVRACLRLFAVSKFASSNASR